ncbi:TrkH family potassium uptake protein [Candidatus Margulisiibacteriota bacterium]
MNTKVTDYIISFIALFAFLLLLIENSSYFAGFSNTIKLINITILIVFASELCYRFFTSANRPSFLKSNWFSLIVFIPLVQFVTGAESTPLTVIIRQIVIITMLMSRASKALNLIKLLNFKPAQTMLATFSFTIGAGAILLMLPVATNSGAATSLIDAIFTATSATCVTGLSVQDTASHFSLFGKTVILTLIQLGGLGIMTFSVSLALVLKKSVNLSKQIEMQEVLDQDTLTTTKNLTAFIIKMTLLIEIVGALVLFMAWKDRFANPLTTLYNAVFHSISAFCNAGFSTFSDSLTRFATDPITNITISLLIIFGGLGFLVIKDLFDNIRYKFTTRGHKLFKLRVHTKIVLVVSLGLIFAGWALLYLVESNSAFGAFEPGGKALLSFFHSVSARTAGFNSCEISSLAPASLLIMIVLMFIGASTGSTGGGLKTTTFFVLWSAVISGFKKKQNVEAYKRTIPLSVVQKASNLFVFSIAILMVFTVALLYFEKHMFLDILFETVSAFGTVGLSTGITPSLTNKGKVLLTLLMFIGRLGPLTIGYALIVRKKPAKYFYPEERVMIG